MGLTRLLRALGTVFPSLMFLIVVVTLYYFAVAFYALERWVVEVSWATSVTYFSSYYIEVALVFLLLMLRGYRALRIVSLGFIVLVYLMSGWSEWQGLPDALEKVFFPQYCWPTADHSWPKRNLGIHTYFAP